MQKSIRIRIPGFFSALLLLLGNAVWAQHLADRPRQAAAGAIDVHLGAASFLQANHFSLAKGDSVRVVGVSSATRQATVFLVRVIQKAGQSLVLRTAKGAPLSLAGARALGVQKAQQQEGAR